MLVVEDLKIANMVRRAKPVPDPEQPGQYLANGARREVRPEQKYQRCGLGRFPQRVTRQSGGRWACSD